MRQLHQCRAKQPKAAHNTIIASDNSLYVLRVYTTIEQISCYSLVHNSSASASSCWYLGELVCRERDTERWITIHRLSVPLLWRMLRVQWRTWCGNYRWVAILMPSSQQGTYIYMQSTHAFCNGVHCSFWQSDAVYQPPCSHQLHPWVISLFPGSILLVF
jgi:hypothetical protein